MFPKLLEQRGAIPRGGAIELRACERGELRTSIDVASGGTLGEVGELPARIVGG